MSDAVFSIRNPRAGTMGTAACALVSDWWHRYRSRLELASYSHEQRKDLGFSADLDHEIAKLLWRNEVG
jgi:uncharacterized protein YjiS (DUF1127 family)